MPGELRILGRISEVRAAVCAARAEGRSIGLVPTMGALHSGHGRLIEVAAAECGFVVVSLFVNPTQFGPNEDLERYPRTPEADQARCRAAGADVLFQPSVAEMYPAGSLATVVEVPAVSRRWEGEHRPTHFRGVATVVLKLLQIVGPDRAYFGEKDFQQLQVIRRLVADLDVPVEVVGVPTVRESDGLAMSSRNRYLNEAERQTAKLLARALIEAQQLAHSGQVDVNPIRQVLRRTLELGRDVTIDYAEVVDAETLEPLERLDSIRPARAILAVRLPSARLIDNAPLPRPDPPA
jgi:pantoate--beta-alanine ligase